MIQNHQHGHGNGVGICSSILRHIKVKRNMRKKKFKFSVGMKIEELSRISLLSGIFFCKTRLTNGGDFAEHTNRESVASNCVKWENEFRFTCKLSASPTTGILETCMCRISVRKEVKGGKSHDKVGYVDVNLAEYAGAGSVTRHYILEGYHDGKKNRQDNCILKISAEMTLISGDPLFKPQDKPTDFLITGMGDTKLSTSESFISNATVGQEPIMRRVCSESLDLPLAESPTHAQHKRNISNGSSIFQYRNTSGELRNTSGELRNASGELRNASGEFRNASGEIRNSGPPAQVLSHSRQSSGTTADSACADLDTFTAAYQSPLQINKRASHRRINETRKNANDVVDQLFKVEDLMLDTSNTDEGIELNMFLEDGVSTMSKIETRRYRDRGNPSFPMDVSDRFKTL